MSEADLGCSDHDNGEAKSSCKQIEILIDGSESSPLPSFGDTQKFTKTVLTPPNYKLQHSSQLEKRLRIDQSVMETSQQKDSSLERENNSKLSQGPSKVPTRNAKSFKLQKSHQQDIYIGQMPQLKLSLKNDYDDDEEEADFFEVQCNSRTKGNQLLIQSSSNVSPIQSERCPPMRDDDNEQWRLYAQTQELARKANELFQQAISSGGSSVPASQAKKRRDNANAFYGEEGLRIQPERCQTDGSRKCRRFDIDESNRSGSSSSFRQVRKHVEIVEERSGSRVLRTEADMEDSEVNSMMPPGISVKQSGISARQARIPIKVMNSDDSGSRDASKDSNRFKSSVGDGLIQSIVQKIGAAEDIYHLPRNCGQDSDSPAWRRRQIRNQRLRMRQAQEQARLVECAKAEAASRSVSNSEAESDKDASPDAMPGDQEGEGPPPTDKKNESVQEKYDKVGSRIAIQTKRAIKIKDYPELLKYQIYESYKPHSLAQTREYLSYLTKNEVGKATETPSHLIDYCASQLDTKIPQHINEKHILSFDANFESGNLDSVYIHNITQTRHEYNLLMKVDTNTRGNTHWFHFKVTNFIAGDMIYRFNILNFTRSMSQFYQNGMNVIKRAEPLEVAEEVKDKVCQEPAEDWQYAACHNVQFESSQIPRLVTNLGNTADACYGKLTFDYKFKPEEIGKAIYFAYSVPYTYSDLLKDLEAAKETLVAQAAASAEESPGYRVLESPPKESAVPSNNGAGAPDVSPTAQPVRKGPSNSAQVWRQSVAKKKSAMELHHEQIKNAADQQLQARQNKFENRWLRHTSGPKNDFTEAARAAEGTRSDNQQDEASFEIMTNVLLYRQEVIAQSMGGLNVYQLTVTKRRDNSSVRHSKKKVIYIQARLHAAETHGSIIMRDIIKDLTVNHHKYDKLLSKCIIKLVPMINPDGVVIGNSRTSLAGVDLNRRWANPDATIHPELFFLKNNMKVVNRESAGIAIFCDLHGHNRQLNCFFYGSNKAPNEGLLSWTKTRLIPKIFERNEQRSFNFQMCKFSTDKAKYNTARVVIWNELKVTNSFTLETSMYGRKLTQDENAVYRTSSRRAHKVVQLVDEDFNIIALSVLRTFSQYMDVEAVLEKEFKQTGGWLKVKKMNEITQNLKVSKKALSSYNGKLAVPRESTHEAGSSAERKSTVGRHKSSRAVDTGGQKQVTKEESSMHLSGRRKQVSKNRSSQAADKPKDDELPQIKSTSPGPKENGKPPLNDMSATKKKRIQVNRVRTTAVADGTQDDADVTVSDQMPEVLKRYFEPSEFRRCLAQSQREADNAALGTGRTSRTNDPISDAASDSQPSCDNLDWTELKDRFKDALSDDDGERSARSDPRSNGSRRRKRADSMPGGTLESTLRDDELMVVIEETAEQNADTTVKRGQQRHSSSSNSIFQRVPLSEERQLRTKDTLEDMQNKLAQVSDAGEITKALTRKLELLAQDIDRSIKREKQKIGRVLHNRAAKSTEASGKFQQHNKRETVQVAMPRQRAPDLALLRHQPGLISQLNRAQARQAAQSRQGQRARPSNPQQPAAPKSGEGPAPTHQYRLDHRYVEQQQQPDYGVPVVPRHQVQRARRTEQATLAINARMYDHIVQQPTVMLPMVVSGATRQNSFARTPARKSHAQRPVMAGSIDLGSHVNMSKFLESQRTTLANRMQRATISQRTNPLNSPQSLNRAGQQQLAQYRTSVKQHYQRTKEPRYEADGLLPQRDIADFLHHMSSMDRHPLPVDNFNVARNQMMGQTSQKSTPATQRVPKVKASGLMVVPTLGSGELQDGWRSRDPSENIKAATHKKELRLASLEASATASMNQTAQSSAKNARGRRRGFKLHY